MDILRKVFWLLNKFFMVPAFRLGLGQLICNPFSGYVMVIKNIGRKTGKLRYTPTNYAIINGQVYCLAGFGRKAHWYLNMVTNPEVELILPGRAILGRAAEVEDPAEALDACKQVLRNAGFAGFMEGYNPFSAPDEKFQGTLKRAPVLRIQQLGIGNGPKDQGGWGWISLWGGIALLGWLLSRLG
ncbi:MAG: nitroreductase/quinone reductase family protein [Chloroflexota bacterium]